MLINAKIIMKHTKTIVLCGLLLCLSIPLIATQTNLYVQLIGTAEPVAFSIADRPTITFGEGTTMKITTSKGAENFSLENVQNLSFIKTVVTSIDPVEIDDYFGISLFPNPVRDQLTLEIQNLRQGLNYRVFDMNGKQIAIDRVHSNTTQIQMGNFREGFYIFSVEHNGQLVQSFRIVKQ